MSTAYDLCLAWNWEHDAPFVDLLDASCRARGRTLLQVTPATLERTLAGLAQGDVTFRALLDRTSEGDPRFLPVVEWARKAGALSVNAYEQARRAWDKSLMHAALFSVVRTPYTIVLPAHAEQATLETLDLTPLGECFSIKPAHGGGGDGVIVEAHTLADVLAARVSYPADKYLLQTHVHPARLGNRVAWFRIIYCAGEVYPCWWDVNSHFYVPVTAAEESHFGLAGLRSITGTVARVTGLRLFSTEIALTPDGELVTVDYANDPIDLRLQSRCVEGVPDDIARFVAERLVALAGER
jgi:hypothetical protein